MNIKTIARKAKRSGYKVGVLRDGVYTITDTRHENNPQITTDKKGLELFIMHGIDEYLAYCEEKGIETF